MKTLETNHGGNWLDRLLNAWPWCLDADSIRTAAIAWDAEGVYFPASRSLFYNGYVFFRLTFPFGAWLHIKPVRSARFQCGAGWKVNGRFGLTLRWQTDAKAAQGAHENAPNLGQASAWARGTA